MRTIVSYLKIICSTEIVLLSLLLTGCVFPHDPQPEPLPQVAADGQNDGNGVRVFPVNGTIQICNPSIALDTAAFPGCMLWLNFSGELAVKVPDSFSAFLGWSDQHDRLTIVDTANTVRWFMMREELGGDALTEFQDPEWSTHPEYLVTLFGTGEHKDYRCIAVHPESRKYLQLCDSILHWDATPHLWVDRCCSIGDVPDTVVFGEDGCADSAAIASFFKTRRVKLVVAKKTGRYTSLYLRDFSDVHGTWIALRRPSDREGWTCESPQISPDGNWIVFNAYKTPDHYETYIQRLKADARPLLFKTETSDPHWWVHPADTSLMFVVYQEVPGDNLVYGDYTDEKYLATAELGTTSRQMLRLFPDAATESAGAIRVGQPEVLVNLPMKGGLSPDGRYLCTGYSRAFIVGLP